MFKIMKWPGIDLLDEAAEASGADECVQAAGMTGAQRRSQAASHGVAPLRAHQCRLAPLQTVETDPHIIAVGPAAT